MPARQGPTEVAAVVVLGTPAVASAEAPSISEVPVVGALLPDGAALPTDVVPGTAVPGAGSGSAAPDPVESLEAGAACVQGLVPGIQVSIGGIVSGLTGLLVGLAGGGSTTPAPSGSGESAVASIPMTPEQLVALLSPAQLQSLLAGGSV